MKGKADAGSVSAIEITSFCLSDGFTLNDFIAINTVIDPWLKKQPGFLSRHIAAENDGRIVDVLFWKDVEAGTESMHRLMKEFSDSPIHTMIDQQTVHWSITPVYHQLKLT